MKILPHFFWLLPMLVVFGFFSACSPVKPINEENSSGTTGAEGQTAETTANETWKNAFAGDVDQIDKLYTDLAAIITDSGTVYNQTEIKDFYAGLKAQFKKIESIQTTHLVEVTPELQYEIGQFTTSANRQFKHLLIWKKENGGLRRELEVFSEAADNKVDLDEIRQARENWMKLCNQHDAYQLVHDLYLGQAVYFNHKPVVIGTEDIAMEYSYMNDPAYHLTLTPLAIEPVNPRTVFEVGQCAGSYNGKYMLFWRRTADGEWKILMDSNL